MRDLHSSTQAVGLQNKNISAGALFWQLLCVVKCLSTSRVWDTPKLCGFKYLRLSRCQKIEFKPNPFFKLFWLLSSRESHRLSLGCGFQKSDGASARLCNLAVVALPQCKFTAVPPRLCWDRNLIFKSTRDRLETSIDYTFLKKIQIFQQFFSWIL